MITGKLKSDLDKLWLEFHSGGITNPLTVIEQISYLMFARLLELVESRNERKAKAISRRSGEAFEHKRIFSENQQHLRWSHLTQVGADELLRLLNGSAKSSEPQEWMNLFQFYRSGLHNGTPLGKFFKDAQCMIQKASLASVAVSTIDKLPILEGDTKGDLYEYLLSKLSTAGVAGQFRTPRHIIRAMVEILDPKPDEIICDPACGTGGFLTQVMDYLKEKYTSPGLEEQEKDDNGKPVLDAHGNYVFHYPGDLLHPYQKHISEQMFHGFDFDSTMLRIAAMNMLLHNIEKPCIEYKDSLSEQANVAKDYEETFDVVLANPPFKGSIDGDNVYKGLTSVAKTKKTELLFIILMEKILKIGGRCAVIVPDGVLFGSSTAHQAVREMLVEKNQLEAVISLPSGVFKPYAGVSTAVLVFTKGGLTDNVFFYKVESDGYSLDDKRNPVKENDLPELKEQWKKWKEVRECKKLDSFADRSEKAFYVSKREIFEQKYDLSLNRYAEVKHDTIEYDPPKTILKKLRDLEEDILNDLDDLDKLLINSNI
ncbi:MAG: N-6 DNA methylase [bacterium]|nr:N-6 DNA methylase [bacterium]